MVKHTLYSISTIFLFWVIIPNHGLAQKGQELGGYIGASHYFGDLNVDYSINDPGIAFGIIARNNFNERVCLAGSFNFARLSASDDDAQNSFQRTRNLSFFSNTFDASVSLEFNFFTYIHGDRRYYYTPYASIGIVASKYNPRTELNGTKYNLEEFSTEGQDGYALFSPGLAFAVGFKWDLNYRWSFNAGIKARRLSTDYLDDVSTVYPDLNTMPGGPTGIAAQLSDRSGMEGFATPGKQRGNSLNNDSYVIVHISIVRFFSQLECPKVSKIEGF